MTTESSPIAETIAQTFKEHKVVSYIVVEEESTQLIHTTNPPTVLEILAKLHWGDFPFNPNNYNFMIVQCGNFSFGVLQLGFYMNTMRYLVGFIPVDDEMDLSSQISFFERALIFYVPDNVDYLNWDDSQCVQGFPDVFDAFQIVNKIYMIHKHNAPTPVMCLETQQLIDDVASSFTPPDSGLS